LVHLRKWPHLTVSFIYFGVQMVINTVVILALPKTPKLSTQMSMLFIVMVALVAVYIAMQSTFRRSKSAE
jgi:hypothetical protein